MSHDFVTCDTKVYNMSHDFVTCDTKVNNMSHDFVIVEIHYANLLYSSFSRLTLLYVWSHKTKLLHINKV